MGRRSRGERVRFLRGNAYISALWAATEMESRAGCVRFVGGKEENKGDGEGGFEGRKLCYLDRREATPRCPPTLPTAPS